MRLHVGTSGYAYKEWKGKFYPDGLPAKKMLNFYSAHFGSVEINGTFRRIPKASVFEAWMKEVPSKFKFALKAPQQITHNRKLKDCEEPMGVFLEAGRTLGKQLGPILFQLPPYFKADIQRLKEFLKLIPKDIQAAFEFRHESWLIQEVFDLLRKRNAALCLAESEETIEIPFEPTASWGYLRLRRLDYSKAELKKWATAIQEQKWKEAFIYFRHEDTAIGPRFAKEFFDLLA